MAMKISSKAYENELGILKFEVTCKMRLSRRRPQVALTSTQPLELGFFLVSFLLKLHIF